MLEAVKDRNAVIISIMHAAHLEHLWTDAGPTDEARRIRDGVSEDARNVELRTWVRLSFAAWDGSGGLTVAEMMDTLSDERLTIALTLLIRISLGTDAAEALADFDAEDPGEGGHGLN